MDWEASFSLPASSRQRVLQHVRLRNCRAPPPQLPSTPPTVASAFGAGLDGDAQISRPLLRLSSSDGGASEACRLQTTDVASKTQSMAHVRKRRLIFSECESEKVDGTTGGECPTSARCLPKNDCDTDGVGCSSMSVASVSKRSRKRPPPTKPTEIKMEATTLHSAAFDDGKLPSLLRADFFKCDALDLAPRLLGKFLRRDEVVLQITEVEAYRPNDSACHGRFGITARTAPVFGPGGHAYVYLCYGLHIMLNIVADLEGVGAAVLIRSCAPVAGMKTIQSRRGLISDKPVLLTGPGKVGQALGLTTEWSNHPLYIPGGLEVLDGPDPDDILVGPRVGIDYASSKDAAALWRFAIAGTPWISAPRNTLTRT